MWTLRLSAAWVDQVGREVGDVDLSSRFCVLCVIHDHRVDVVDSGLQLIVAQLALSQAEWTALIGTCRASIIADRTVAYLTSGALRVAQVSALFLAIRALPLGAVASVGILLALEAQVCHALGAIRRADAAADTVIVRWAHLVPHVAPLVDEASLWYRLRNARTARYRLLFVAILSVLMHPFPRISATADGFTGSPRTTTRSS